jgi:hypothetical protein
VPRVRVTPGAPFRLKAYNLYSWSLLAIPYFPYCYAFVKDIDEIRKRIGVDRGALIKVWLHEKVKQEKSANG